MTRRVFRYVPYVITQDPTAAPEYAARCVSGEEADCDAESGAWPDPADVEEWQRRHTQDTRHTRYRRTFADYAVLNPAEEGQPPPCRALRCGHGEEARDQGDGGGGRS